MKKRQDKNCFNSSYRKEEKNKLQMAEKKTEMKMKPFVRRTIFPNDIKKLSNEMMFFEEKKLKI